MNWSESTLVSFGDSFTFGQGTEGEGISYIEYTEKYKKLDNKQIIKQWIERSNSASYTTLLAKKLGCFKFVNLGHMGASNQHTILYLREFIRKNHKSTNVYLIGLTDPWRHITLQYKEPKRKHTNYGPYLCFETIRPDVVDLLSEQKKLYSSNYHKNLDSRFWGNYITSFRTHENVLYSHIDNYYTICEILKGKQYFMFDIMNNIDYQISRTTMPEVHVDQQHFQNVKEDNLVKAGFKSLDIPNKFIYEYTQHVINNKRYFDYYTLNHYYKYKKTKKQLANLDVLMHDYGYTAKYDTHWNSAGHQKVTDILHNYITNIYTNQTK